jgi:hypothetical protein
MEANMRSAFVLVGDPIPVSAKREAVKVAVFALVALIFTLSGCDAIAGFLGMSGEETSASTSQPEPMAEGGEVAFITVEGVLYEVHTFRAPDDTEPAETQVEDTLLFIRIPASETVEVVVVAGGGGGGRGKAAGANGYTGSGGGAGGFVYHPAFKVGDNELWDVDRTISVKVGVGGKYGVESGARGSNGGNSAFVRNGAYQIIAEGGGGGAGFGGDNSQGRDGGSGGGSHNSVETHAVALPGTAPDEPGVLNLGNDGAYKTNGGFKGGGAGEIDPQSPTPISEQIGTGIPFAITGELKWYACGGAANSPAGESGTGNGGGGSVGGPGGGTPAEATAGGSGIVIVRWPHEQP